MLTATLIMLFIAQPSFRRCATALNATNKLELTSGSILVAREFASLPREILVVNLNNPKPLLKIASPQTETMGKAIDAQTGKRAIAGTEMVVEET